MSATMTKTSTSDDKYGKINMAGMEEGMGFWLVMLNYLHYCWFLTRSFSRERAELFKYTVAAPRGIDSSRGSPTSVDML